MASSRQLLTHRFAEPADCCLLAQMNQQLILDEGHRNRMNVEELEDRTRDWLAEDYRAVLFSDGAEVVAYALYRELEYEIYLRQLFVVCEKRRQGIGRRAMQILRSKLWPTTKRLTVEVLAANQNA